MVSFLKKVLTSLALGASLLGAPSTAVAEGKPDVVKIKEPSKTKEERGLELKLNSNFSYNPKYNYDFTIPNATPKLKPKLKNKADRDEAISLRLDLSSLYLNLEKFVNIIIDNGSKEVRSVADGMSTGNIYGFNLGAGLEYFLRKEGSFPGWSDELSIGFLMTFSTSDFFGGIKKEGHTILNDVIDLNYDLDASVNVYTLVLYARHTSWHDVNKHVRVGPTGQLQLMAPMYDGSFEISASPSFNNNSVLGEGSLSFKAVGMAATASFGVGVDLVDYLKCHLDIGWKFEIYHVKMKGKATIFGKTEPANYNDYYLGDHLYLGFSCSIPFEKSK